MAQASRKSVDGFCRNSCRTRCAGAHSGHPHPTLTPHLEILGHGIVGPVHLRGDVRWPDRSSGLVYPAAGGGDRHRRRGPRGWGGAGDFPPRVNGVCRGAGGAVGRAHRALPPACRYSAAAGRVGGGGLRISLSVMMGLPAVLAALWIAIRGSRTRFADYLALRWPSWTDLAIGVVALIVLVMGWDLLSRAAGREIAPGFMGEVLNSARADGSLWLLGIAFVVAAPLSEEFFARGFLYPGWAESFLAPVAPIILSSLVWTALHLQYDWFFFGEVFSIGLLLGYLRYRFNSTWLTISVHGLNNLAAVVQTMLLAGQG